MICDWDETLVHTLPTLKNAYDFVFDSLNLPRKPYCEVKELTHGCPKSELFLLMVDNNKKLENQARKLFYQYIKKHHLKEMTVIDGAPEFLDYCKNQNIKLYILSSKSPEFLCDEVTASGLCQFFSGIYGSPHLSDKEEEVSLEKPYYGSFKALFKGNPPPAEECCVIGDGLMDYTLAQNIGCPAIIVNETFKDGIHKISQAIGKINELNRKNLINFTRVT